MKTRHPFRTASFGLLALIFLSTPLAGICAAFGAETRPFSQGTAYTLPQGRLEAGVFAPLRYGLRDDVEISVHPLLMFAWPAIAVKKQWAAGEGWAFSSTHTLETPTPFLRLIQVEGTGGLLPTDNTIPWFAMSEHRALFTARVAPAHELTLMAGVTGAIHFGKMHMDTIDYPLAFHRLAPLHRHAAARFGADLDGRIAGDWFYCLDMDLFVLDDAASRFSVEHSFGLIRRTGKRHQIFFGYKFSWAQLPFGTQSVLLPLVDFVWSF